MKLDSMMFPSIRE